MKKTLIYFEDHKPNKRTYEAYYIAVPKFLERLTCWYLRKKYSNMKFIKEDP